MFLQIPTKFVTVQDVFFPRSRPDRPQKISSRLCDGSIKADYRAPSTTASIATVCKRVISGPQIEVVGGTNGLRSLHLKCSTAGCLSTPVDWILPVKSDTVREIDILFRDNGA